MLRRAGFGPRALVLTHTQFSFDDLWSSVCCYLDPEAVPSALAHILLLADEAPLQTDVSFQLVLDPQLGRDDERFKGTTLPVLLVSS